MSSNHILNNVNLKIRKQGHLSLYDLYPQLYSFCELIISQQSNSSGKEAVCYDNFKIEGKNGCN